MKITILDLHDIITDKGIPAGIIAELIENEEFPMPIFLDIGMAGWVELSVDDWIKSNGFSTSHLYPCPSDDPAY